MSVKVSIPLNRPISANINSSNSINTNIASKKAAAKVQNLADVDVANVEDGYTLIFNSTTGKWEAVDPATNVNLSAIDGGTY
jgi:hypothetical protein